MSAYEPYDYASVPFMTAADYDTVALTLKAQGTIRESGVFNQVVHLADDNSEEVVSLSLNPIFYIEIPWNNMTESDSGTVWDYWCDTTTPKAAGRSRTFKYTHSYGTTPSGGVTTHTYVVRFDCDISRDINIPKFFNMSVKLRIKGKIAD